MDVLKKSKKFPKGEQATNIQVEIEKVKYNDYLTIFNENLFSNHVFFRLRHL